MGEPLAEIDTDKATMEMQALGSGVLRKILIQEGGSAPLGQIIAIIGEPEEDISALISQAASSQPAKGPAPTDKESEPDASPATTTAPANKELGKTTEKVASTGDATGNGRHEAQPVASASTGASSGRLIVSPLAARMAAESGIDLRSVRGSGPGGRIIKRDVEGLIIGGKRATPDADQSPQRHLRAVEPSPFQKSSTAQASAYRDEPASEMRRTIAKRLVTSLGPVPHFFLTTEIEMDRAAEMRQGINELDPELKISINDIIIKVASAALMQHPQVNASFQDKAVRYYEHADIGVAVAIDEGLITPIVRSADQKSLSEIAAEVRDLAARARDRKLKPEEYLGASFSISNLGMFGIDEFTAIINPPEAAILAVGAMSLKPVVRNNEIVVRQTMRVTMSCDHRVVDGATGAKFLQTFKKILENPLFLVV
jgi:pyruvate dehydrogenase E2 component (dihydrolipoamide acetyltransferase)